MYINWERKKEIKKEDIWLAWGYFSILDSESISVGICPRVVNLDN